jgi:hypothetical protein
MTVIDPNKRPTATQMLQEPIFKQFENTQTKAYGRKAVCVSFMRQIIHTIVWSKESFKSSHK